VLQPDWGDSTICIVEYLFEAHTAAQIINMGYILFDFFEAGHVILSPTMKLSNFNTELHHLVF